MSEIVIRITVPDGTTVRVDQGSPDFESEPLPPEPNAPAFRGAANGNPRPVSDMCPVHRLPWKPVPAGVSRTTNKPYDAFLACQNRDCKERP